MIDKKLYGVLKDGREVYIYTIKNNLGEYVELVEYGATIHSIYVSSANGQIDDVILGALDIDNMQSKTLAASVIGRCASRIPYGRLTVNGKELQLETNSNGHCLHSASGNYAYKLFSGRIIEESNTVEFTYHDTGEGGFGCGADVSVAYSFDDEHRLKIQYRITPEDDTVISPTNHAYFNLEGTGDIREHLLQINADYLAKKGETGIPEGELLPVNETPFDFMTRKTFGEGFSSDKDGLLGLSIKKYDDTFIFSKDKGQPVARVSSQKTGRYINVYTDMPALVLFTPYPEMPVTGKNGAVYEGYCAFCLETQFVPNAINCPQYDSPLFKKGETLSSTTIYEFGVC